MKRTRDMLASELIEQLAVAIVYDEGGPFLLKLRNDPSAKLAAQRLVDSLHGDREIRQILEKIPE